ncbi:hypothetical protein HAX54_015386 [Datura stramonium]|uniref:Uncharacterized protein n=1 Tax=Datura stramonium TaxID=4076 RepID=A0ABS8TSQ0_DATST|nr:hypothetical protein [Datura stramonium]
MLHPGIILDPSLDLRSLLSLTDHPQSNRGAAPKSAGSKASTSSNHAPKVTNGLKRKIDMVKNTRDYSFLLSDDAELPGPSRGSLTQKVSAPNYGFDDIEDAVSSTRGKQTSSNIGRKLLDDESEVKKAAKCNLKLDLNDKKVLTPGAKSTVPASHKPTPSRVQHPVPRQSSVQNRIPLESESRNKVCLCPNLRSFRNSQPPCLDLRNVARPMDDRRPAPQQRDDRRPAPQHRDDRRPAPQHRDDRRPHSSIEMTGAQHLSKEMTGAQHLSIEMTGAQHFLEKMTGAQHFSKEMTGAQHFSGKMIGGQQENQRDMMKMMMEKKPLV